MERPLPKTSARLEGVLERDRELQLLVQVVDRPAEGLVALQHKVGPALDAVEEGREVLSIPA